MSHERAVNPKLVDMSEGIETKRKSSFTSQSNIQGMANIGSSASFRGVKDLMCTVIVALAGGVIFFVGWYNQGFQTFNKSTKLYTVVGYFLLIAGTLFATCPPIPQSQDYHNFADKRCLCCVPNTLDVLSNIPFAFVAAIGLVQIFFLNDSLIEYGKLEQVARQNDTTYSLLPVFSRPNDEKFLWGTYFVGVGLVSFGSSYYHLKPNDARLVWDRIPMTISFMSLLALIVSESFDVIISPIVLFLLIFFGIGSVLFWHFYHDLRLYILVQFGSLIAIPVCFMMSSVDGEARYQETGQNYAIALSFYGAAKIAEVCDHQIYHLTRKHVSGHSIKHLLSGAATAWAIVILASRELNEARLSPNNTSSATCASEIIERKMTAHTDL